MNDAVAGQPGKEEKKKLRNLARKNVGPWYQTPGMMKLTCVLFLIYVSVVPVWSLTFPAAEYDFLQELYDSTQGEAWIWNGSPNPVAGVPWNFSNPLHDPCTLNWQGVNCSTNGTEYGVTWLSLPSHNLVGPLPPSISILQKLNHLDMNGNFLSNTIPSSLGELTALQYVNFGLNRFTGTVPSSLGNLAALYELDLYTNKLSGTIPDSIANLVNILFFSFGGNYMTGTLPSWIGGLTLLQGGDVQTNSMTGWLPDSLANLHKLTDLELYDNRFSGPLPDVFAQMQRLRNVIVMRNLLSGPLPPSLGSALALENMYLYGNAFSGQLPESLGNLTLLLQLEGYDNLLSGGVPDSVARMASLVNLDLHNNLLSGPLSAGLQSVSTLLDLSLGTNKLTGSLPRYFTALPNLNELQLQDNLLTGTLDDVFNASVLHGLSIIDVSGNLLTGTLPVEVFVLPALHTFVAVGNCFEGPLPVTDICASPVLLTLVLDGLRSASSCQRKLLPGLSSSHLVTDPLRAGLDACLFQMPSLATLHLSGNGLTGSLPDVCSAPGGLSGQLSDLALSHNSLTGTIPSCMQDRIWHNLDLSYNRLTGTLRPDFAVNLSLPKTAGTGPTAMSLQKNRLSGVIPGGVNAYANLTILTSNLFSCRLDKSDLPKSDGERLHYQCGSDYFNLPYYVWMGLTAALAALAVAHRAGKLPDASALDLSWLHPRSQYETSPGAVGAPDRVFGHLARLLHVALSCTAYEVLVMLPVYAILNSAFGTVEHKSAWTVSAAYLSGIVPGSCILVVLALLLLQFALVWRRSAVACEEVVGGAEKLEAEAAVDQEQAQDSLSALSKAAMCASYVGVNFFVVAGVNTAYVIVALNYSGSTFIAAQILLSFFKLLWNRVGGVYLIRFVANKAARFEDAHFERNFELLKVFVALANNIAIPCLVVAVTSPDCFYDLFAAAPDVTSTYNFIECFIYNPTDALCNSFTEHVGSTRFSPPFTYSYQCSASFVTYYAPAFLYLCLMASVLSPCLQLAIQALHRRAAVDQMSRWYRLVHAATPPILRPLPAEPPAGGARNIFQPYFDGSVLQINLVTYAALILTFGAVFPPLAAALLVTIVVVLVVARWKVRCFAASAKESGAEWALQILGVECASVTSALRHPAVMWMLVTLSFWFFTLFLFDMVGDAVGFHRALWVLIVVPLVPLVLYGADKAVRAFAATAGVKDSSWTTEEQAQKKSRDSELAMVVSPLA